MSSPGTPTFSKHCGRSQVWGCEHTGLMRRRRMQVCRRLLLPVLRDCLVMLRDEWRDLERASHKNCQCVCDLIIQCLVVSISDQKTTRRAVLSNQVFRKKARNGASIVMRACRVLVHLLMLYLRQTQHTAYSYSIGAYIITAYSI